MGIWLVFAPWALQFAGAAAGNSIVFGFLVVVVAAASLSVEPENHTWAWINLVLGAWVFIAPWAVGFAVLPTAFWNSFVVGSAIVVFAFVRMAAGRRVTTGRVV